MKKYRCSIEIIGDIEAPNAEEAKKKFADKLSDDYFTFFDSSDVKIVNEEGEESEDTRISDVDVEGPLMPL